MDERRAKDICFNCDKYSKEHKCGEKKLFYIDHEEEKENDQEPPQAKEIEPTTPEDITATISFPALARISTLQTLKIKEYIKNKR